MGKYYGIDVGGSAVKLGLFSDGVPERLWEIPTDLSQAGAHILSDIARALPERADGAALAVPGAVRPDGTVNRCVNLGWGVCRPADEFTRLTGIFCRVCNDANAAALGEQWRGGGRDYQSVLLVTLGTGVGAGFVRDGAILSGAHGSAGELGHICVRPEETEPCSCGNYGCLEQYCSGAGMARLAERAGLGRIDAKTIFSLAAAGNETATRLLDNACDTLGRGIAAVCGAVDPEAVLLGGGVSRAGEPLRARVEAAFRRYAFHACRETPILPATLGAQAGVYGAARLAMRQ